MASAGEMEAAEGVEALRRRAARALAEGSTSGALAALLQRKAAPGASAGPTQKANEPRSRSRSRSRGGSTALCDESPAEAWATSCRTAAETACSMSQKKMAKLAKRRANRGKAPAEDDVPLVNRKSALCQRVRLLLAFDGTAFHGWMRQPDFRTVQEVIEDVLRSLLCQRIRVTPSSRTDAGVHALAMVSQFEAILVGLKGGTSDDLDVEDAVSRFLVPLLNARLPDDIKVLNAEVTHPGFNVMETRWKRYIYRIRGRGAAEQLQLQRMREGAQAMEGTHDFGAFQSQGGRQATVRTLYRCCVEPLAAEPELGLEEGVQVILEGDGFLLHMCRILCGTLVQVALGVREVSQVSSALTTGSTRQAAGPTLPARGLRLEHVEHEQAWSAKLSASLPLVAVETTCDESKVRQALDRRTRGGLELDAAVRTAIGSLNNPPGPASVGAAEGAVSEPAARADDRERG